jgi:hypothetical protein
MPDYKEHPMPYTERDFIDAEGAPSANGSEGGSAAQDSGKGAL